MQEFLQQLVNGLSLGAIYALIAVGYTMVYGILKLINFAHGEVFMVGAMVSLLVVSGQGHLTWAAPHLAPSAWMLQLLLIYGLPAALAATVYVVSWMTGGRPPDWLTVTARVVLAVVGGGLTAELASQLLKYVDVPAPARLLLALTAAMITCAALGYAIESLAYRPLRNRPRITSLITAIGVSLLLQYGGQLALGSTDRVFPDVWPALSRTLSPGGVVFSYVDVVVIALTVALMLALTYVILYTRIGLALRAVSHSFDTASLMGVNIDRVVSFTFVLGSVLAAAGGLLYAIKYVQINPLSGLTPGLKAFVAAVLGGIGSIPGAVVGGILLGLVEVMVVGYLPGGSQYKDGIAFVILIAILLVKPAGLFGRSAVEKV